MRKCIDCGEIKSNNDFYINRGRKDGLCLMCKKCSYVRNKNYVDNNKDSIALKQKEYKQKSRLRDYAYRKNRDGGLYSRYLSMKSRCNHKTNSRYKDYGGRGVKMTWSGYDDFKKDMIKSFIKHRRCHSSWDTTLERIDVDGNYCKENCIWVSREHQAKNKRNTAYLNYKNKKYRITELAEISPVSYSAFRRRLYFYKWSIDRAVEQPKRNTT